MNQYARVSARMLLFLLQLMDGCYNPSGLCTPLYISLLKSQDIMIVLSSVKTSPLYRRGAHASHLIMCVSAYIIVFTDFDLISCSNADFRGFEISAFFPVVLQLMAATTYQVKNSITSKNYWLLYRVSAPAPTFDRFSIRAQNGQ